MPIATPDAWLPVYNWLQRNYPRPGINKTWLQACVDALQAQARADRASGGAPLVGPALFRAAETQLLLSHLGASCLPGTGLPASGDEVHDTMLFPSGGAKGGGVGPGGCLVMVLCVNEIGASAFALQTTMQQRREVISGAGRIRRLRDPGQGARAEPGRRGQDGEGEDEDEDDAYDDDPARLPAYPRGMLALELTDGHTVIKAIEYKRIPGLVLGETMLGSKMILRNVRVLRNILMLTPDCVTLKGHCVDEIEAIQGRLFENGLRSRMGKDELPLDGEVGAGEAEAVVEAPTAVHDRQPPPRAARAQPAAELHDGGDFFDIDDGDRDDGRAAAGPARAQAASRTDIDPPPPKKRLTLPPRLAIHGGADPNARVRTPARAPPQSNAVAGPGPGSAHRPRSAVQVQARSTHTTDPDNDFSMLDPTEEEMEAIMRLEGAAGSSGSGSGQGSSGAARDDPPKDPPSQSKYFGKNKGGAKTNHLRSRPTDQQGSRGMTDQQNGRDDDIDMDAGMDATAPARRPALRNGTTSRTPLFMPASQVDSETEEDSQKENRPVKSAGLQPARTGSRGAGASRPRGGQGEREFREVIELSD